LEKKNAEGGECYDFKPSSFSICKGEFVLVGTVFTNVAGVNLKQ
jgi:hypothetical protein